MENVIILITLPLIGIFFNYLNINIRKHESNKFITMLISLIELYIILYILLTMNFNSNEIQYRDFINIFNLRISLGLDGINISLLFLTVLITPIIILINESSNPRGFEPFRKKIKENNNIYNLILLIEFLLIIIFVSLDILIFFIFFEFILIPMFLLIGKYGSRIKRIEAAYRFIIYTILGSLIMLIAIIYFILQIWYYK